MKVLFVLPIFFFILSCNSHPTSTGTNSGPQPIIRDSNIVKKEVANPYVTVDVSPMDMAYFPADFTIRKMNGEVTGQPLARVLYSRPHRQGRKIFGALLKWGQPWRLGANEASELQLFQAATIQDKKVAKGQYIIYAIPYEDHWTIVLNANLHTWGLKFNPADDVAKFDIPAKPKNQQVEYFTMVFEKTATGADLIMAWENMEARLPIQF